MSDLRLRDVSKTCPSDGVISTRLLAGRTIAHLFRDGSPGQGFEAVAPDLEDVCSSAMSARHGVEATAQ